jgi:DNA-binding NarL/FixJ family response regulator
VTDTPQTVRIVVADDHDIVRTSFAGLLNSQPDFTVIGTAHDGAEAVRACHELQPDVVLMDVRMPVALRAGASGFLLKDVTAEHLFDAVRVIAAGGALLAPTVTRRLISEFALRPAQSDSLSLTDALAELTPRETEVLRLVAEGLSNAEIASRLVVTEETVKTHVSRLLGKLGLRDRTQAVVLAYESGLVVPRKPT